MRIALNKSFKIPLMFLALVFTGLMAYLIYIQVGQPVYQEEKVALYNYQNAGTANYQVLLKPNMLYSQPSMGEGETYITATVDQIRASFNYQFTGERPENIIRRL